MDSELPTIPYRLILQEIEKVSGVSPSAKHQQHEAHLSWRIKSVSLWFFFSPVSEKNYSRGESRALWWYSVLKCQSGRHVISDELGAMCIWSLERTVSCCPIGPPSTGEGKEKEPLEAAESPRQNSLYQPCSSFSVWAIMGQDFIYHLWSPYTMSCEREPLLQSQSDTLEVLGTL